uniref:C-type lectin domain family 3 member A n=2 Tax=Homininae TaxID=207598 RepID=H3BTK1_HUMAN
MAKNGLVICILVITLLLDQTTSHTSRLKARKHSKRRVRGIC